MIFTLLILTVGLSQAYAAVITLGGNPTDIAFDSHLNEVFVSDYDSGSGNTVSVISDASNKVVATIIVGSGPYGIAFDSSERDLRSQQCF